MVTGEGLDPWWREASTVTGEGLDWDSLTLAQRDQQSNSAQCSKGKHDGVCHRSFNRVVAKDMPTMVWEGAKWFFLCRSSPISFVSYFSHLLP